NERSSFQLVEFVIAELNVPPRITGQMMRCALRVRPRLHGNMRRSRGRWCDGRIVFAPARGARRYSFLATGTLANFFSGIVCP
ncbi:MAG: hypothetical protein M3P18_14240, partial [Actinomycetota bacterium]|nr:hypothetical protein [Actinomycetota bacterium]